MNKKFSLVYAMLFFILVGCSNISEDKSKKIIVEEYSNQLGEATILSTEEKNNDYYIEWENKNDKSKGISKVSPNGEITPIESEIE